jgi:hypothetical protein
MPIHRLYDDFFRFLRDYPAETDVWECYQRLYLKPHQRFLSAYWKYFPHLDEEQLRLRVKAIKGEDYAQLKALLTQYDLPAITSDTIDKCRKLLPAAEPRVYLFVGFHSSEGFVIPLDGRPVMGFGLERFTDFNQFDILVAHEYYHYAVWRRGEEESAAGDVYKKLWREGKAVAFSLRVFPGRPHWRHTFQNKRCWSWCSQHERQLLALARSGKATLATFFGAGHPSLNIPPRTGYYVGYRLVCEEEESG